MLGCDGIIYFLIPPPSFMSPSVGLCCATHLICCLQQECLELRPYFLSGGSCFRFHSRHMCLEDFLESATHLKISELPHFWMWGEFALHLGWHINHHAAHKELMPLDIKTLPYPFLNGVFLFLPLFDFSKYSLIRNKFEAHWFQRIGPIHDLYMY